MAWTTWVHDLGWFEVLLMVLAIPILLAILVGMDFLVWCMIFRTNEEVEKEMDRRAAQRRANSETLH